MRGWVVVPGASGVGFSVRVVMSEQQGGPRAGLPRARFLGRTAACAVVVLGLFGAGPAMARHGHVAVAAAAYAPIFEWILPDAETGQVLSQQNPHLLTHPPPPPHLMTPSR